jgi:hypothetical protein
MHPIWVIRIPGYAQSTQMVQTMMPPAQGDQIGRVGRPAVLPMNHMMDVQPPAAITARNATAPIPLLNDNPSAIGHRAEGSTDVHRPAGRLEHRPDAGVAADEPA